MAENSDDHAEPRVIKRALALITEALDLLDAHGGPADAAAHLDLAQQRLRDELTRIGN
jgi:hypothetical protein